MNKADTVKVVLVVFVVWGQGVAFVLTEPKSMPNEINSIQLIRQVRKAGNIKGEVMFH